MSTSMRRKAINPRSAIVLIENSGGYPAVRKKQKVPRGSETSFEELDTSGVDWRYLPCPNDRGLIAMENPGAK